MNTELAIRSQQAPEAHKVTLREMRAATIKRVRRVFSKPGSAEKTSTSIIAIIPAHNEEADIARTLDSLLLQTRKVDMIVVVADNCNDKTVEIAKRYRGVTVYETKGNTDGKVGALTQGWVKFAKGFDYMLGLDSDTVIEKKAVAILLQEMDNNQSAAGVSCRFTLDQHRANTFVHSQLIRAQRFNFSQWLEGIFARQRNTHVLGGQASLFRVRHLLQLTERFDRQSPWVNTTDVEDAETTWRLHEMDKKTLMSGEARAYVGGMSTVSALKNQQRKWMEGHNRMLWDHKSYNKNTRNLVNQQVSFVLNAVSRVLLVAMLALSLSVHQFTWNPIWLIPVIVTILINLKTAIRMPDRTGADIIYALLVLPGELWLITQIWICIGSWINIWFGRKVDRWALQYQAERGEMKSVLVKMIGWTVFIVLAAVAGMWAWMNVTPEDVQRTVLTNGWAVLSVITIILTIGGIIKLLRPMRGLRP